MTMVALSFLVMTIIAWLVMLSSYVGWSEFEMSAWLVLLELAVLVLLYLSILKR